jgi:hypothetical protein
MTIYYTSIFSPGNLLSVTFKLTVLAGGWYAQLDGCEGTSLSDGYVSGDLTFFDCNATFVRTCVTSYTGNTVDTITFNNPSGC